MPQPMEQTVHHPNVQKGLPMVTQSIDATAAPVEAPNQSVNQEGSDSKNLVTSAQSTVPSSQPTASAFTLLIATYNHEGWEILGTRPVAALGEAAQSPPEAETQQAAPYENGKQSAPEIPTEQTVAHNEAEKIFPEEAGSQPPYPYPYLNTFYTEFHAILAEELRDTPNPTKEEKQAAVSRAIARYSGDKNSLGIGWIAVVPVANLPQFKQDAQTLWNMYTIQEIPLNDDNSTKGVYDRMTPAHWGS
jgi:hypothetical protein